MKLERIDNDDYNDTTNIFFDKGLYYLKGHHRHLLEESLELYVLTSF